MPRRAICGQLDEMAGCERAVGVARGDPAGERTDVGDVRIRSFSRRQAAGQPKKRDLCDSASSDGGASSFGEQIHG
jgi:hypothetical protein